MIVCAAFIFYSSHLRGSTNIQPDCTEMNLHVVNKIVSTFDPRPMHHHLFLSQVVLCCRHHANPSLTGIWMPISMLKDLHYPIRSLAVWSQSSTWLITAWNLFRTLIFYSSQSLCGPTNFIYIACPSQQYGEMN